MTSNFPRCLLRSGVCRSPEGLELTVPSTLPFVAAYPGASPAKHQFNADIDGDI